MAGAAAIYLLLPRPPLSRAAGALLGGLALRAGRLARRRLQRPDARTFLFYAFSAAAVGFGALLVTQRNPARAALSFALVVLSTCGLFLLLAAPFLMAATIIIYAGAIIVTFLFVLMLAQQEGPSDADARSREPLLATIIGFVLLGTLLYVLQLQWNYETTGEGQVLNDLARNIAAARPVSEENLKANDGLNRSEILKPLIDALETKEQQVKAAARDDRHWAALNREQRALQDLRQRLDSVFDQEQASRPPTVDEADATLARLETVVFQTKQQYGWPQSETASVADRPSNLSPYSGPQPDLPADQVRRRPERRRRPYMPAENPSYLGRSLFTDYLLPVELGGFLLLAATIGAIAIAHRNSGNAPRPGDSRSERLSRG